MSDFAGEKIDKAGPSTPATIIGFKELPDVGSAFSSFDNKKEADKNLKNFKYKSKIIPIISKLYKIMKDYDADLVEINPLVVSNWKLIALDSKITLDDNSLFKHKEFKKGGESELT